MKYIKLYDNRHDFVFDEQRYFPNTSLVQGEEEPSYFTDVEEVVFELTVTLPTEKVVTGQTYTLAVEYGGADVFSEATVTTTGDVTLNGTQFTANTDGDFSVTATYDNKTVTLNGTSKLMTAAPRTGINDTGCGIYKINIYGNAPKRITFNGEEFTPSQQETFNYKEFYADLTEQTVFVTATAQEEGKWESDVATATYTIPVLETLTASISDDTLEDGQTAQITVKYGNQNVTEHIGIMYTASGDVTCSNGDGIFHIGAGVVTATYSTGSGSIVVSHNGVMGNPNLTPITINVTVAEAAPVPKNIVFADNDVKSIVTNAYGTDGEITEEQAAAVTTFFSGNDPATNPFRNNTYVDSFDEFSYFTGVTEIGTAAFYGCSNMTSITIPENVTYIRERAFDYCYLLGSITIPDSVTYIGRSAFQACTGLNTLNLGSYVETIDLYAFKECSSLTSANIPDSVTTLGDQAFNSCTNLNTVTIGKSVSAITFATFPRTISYVSVSSQNNTYDSRDNCNGIIETATNTLILGCKNTVIPSTVTYIGDYAFNGCTGLTSVTIPANVTSIGIWGFNGCTGLTSVTIPANVTYIGSSAFSGCTGLTSVTIPANVTSIGGSTFYGCTGLTSVTIPNGVTSIGSQSFRSCTGLTSLTIPASVTEIASSAFRFCSGLTSITCEATTPPTLGNNVFDSTNDCPILVPAASVDTYKAAERWSNYADRIQAISGGGDEPEYAVVALDCSQLEDANPFDHYDNEAQSNAEYLGLDFGEDTYVENGVITIPPEDDFSGIQLALPYPAYDGCIGYIKLTHPSAEYKLNDETTSSVGEDAGYTCDVDFDSTTLTTTFSNFVSEDQESPFTGVLALTNVGSTDIKITRIEVAFIPAEEEPAEEEPAEE